MLTSYVFQLQDLLSGIADLHEAARAHLNAVLPVNQLPNELLLEIFNLILGDVDVRHVLSMDAEECQRSDYRQLYTLTHVCQRWRAVAIQSPRLWTSVNFRHRTELMTFAKRSFPLPFALYMQISKSSVAESLLVLRQYSSRLSALHVFFSGGNIAIPQDVFFSLDAPHLESITISWDLSKPMLCRNVLSGMSNSTPRLRALALVPVFTRNPIDISLLPALTHLYLSCQYRSHIFINQLLSLLASTPALEWLQFSSLPTSYDSSKPQPVALVHLKTILFARRCGYGACMELLRMLTTPSLTRVYVDASEIAGSDVLPQLPVMAGITRMKIITERNSVQLITDGPSSGFWFRAEGEDDEGDHFATWLGHLHRILPLEQIVHLDLRLDNNGSTIESLLRHMTSLSELEIMFALYSDVPQEREGAKDALQHVCRALGSRDRPLCPSLRCLTVVTTSDETSHLAYARYIADIASMLQARAEMCGVLRRLILQLDVPQESFAKVRDDCKHLKQYVENLVLPEVDEEPIAFDTHEGWDITEGTRYWKMESDDLPQVELPWLGY